MTRLWDCRPLALCAVAGVTLSLAGCGEGIKQQLGLGKNVPDEYQVVEQAPLSLPPDFHLRPPAPGAPRPQDADARRQAEEILLGPAARQSEVVAGGRSPGELAFLNMAGANEADPGIRQLINRESSVLAAEDEGFVERLMFWQKPEVQGVALDPVAEAERLRDNAAEGRPPSYGGTPVIERRERAPLEGLNPF
jgi:hypothetical protein